MIKAAQDIIIKPIITENSMMAQEFKKYTFKTPVQYMNSVRLSAAMDLLTRTDRKVLDIALDTGFNSLSYFIGVFKQGLGCTPTQFRRH